MAELGLTQPLITEGKTDASGLYRNTFARAARPLDSKIMVSNGIFANMNRFGRSVIPEKCHEASNYLVTDEVCDGLFADALLTGFRAAGISVSKLVVPSVADESGEYSTEPSKNRGVFDTLIDEILEQGISKNSCIISLGGGVVNNICGVIASTLYRGITLVHLTTTTMGAFDAAIDFKQGINHPLGKNLIGTYWPATNILIDPTTFTSLSPRHMLNGVAEALKHGFCQSLDLTELICRPLIDHGTGKLRDPQYLLDVCKACIEIKVPTLTYYDDSDYNEMCPQYGHAIGHAVEHLSWHDGREPLLHGEAVAIGMCVSADVALIMGLCTQQVVDAHYEYVRATGLPAFVPDSIDVEDVLYKMSFDKHHVKKPTMGLCKDIGYLAKNGDSFAWEVDEETISQALVVNMSRRDAVKAAAAAAGSAEAEAAASAMALGVGCVVEPPAEEVAAAVEKAVSAARMQPLECHVMSYAWGKEGVQSLVGRLAQQTDGFELEAKKPYAELWMGTHPNGPSSVRRNGELVPLHEYLSESTSADGNKDLSTKEKAMGLPFLFKILSVRKALSIQAHPDKSLAAQLHADNPDCYKDDNHKPEMAMAVTPFEALCSFQSLDKISHNMTVCPELAELVGESAVGVVVAAVSAAAALVSHGQEVLGVDANAPAVAKSRADIVAPALRTLFTALMTAEPTAVAAQLDKLTTRLTDGKPTVGDGAATSACSAADKLALRLFQQYEHDVGVFCAYLLNYVTLQPGEALFLAANEPHAYIYGDCVECMATSDNVIRAGLTPKFKDVDVLCDSLTYHDGEPHFVTPKQIADGVYRYTPPVPEFLVDRVRVANGYATTLPAAPEPSIVAVLDGSGVVQETSTTSTTAASTTQATDTSNSEGALPQHEVTSGHIFVLAPHTELRVNSDSELQLYRATARYELEAAR